MTKTEFFEAFAKHEYAVRVASQEEHDDFVNASPWEHFNEFSESFSILRIDDEDIDSFCIVGYAGWLEAVEVGVDHLISYQEYISLTSEPVQETICLDVDLVL